MDTVALCNSSWDRDWDLGMVGLVMLKNVKVDLTCENVWHSQVRRTADPWSTSGPYET